MFYNTTYLLKFWVADNARSSVTETGNNKIIMSKTAQNGAATLSDSGTPSKTHREQSLRKRRVIMSFASYQVTLVIVTFCWYLDLLPGYVPFSFFGLSVLLNGTFLLLIHFNINLRFADPSMTALQMVVSIVPPLWAFYFLDSGQARAVFMVIATVPALYGILSLRTHQFIIVNFSFFALYGLTMLAIWINRPQSLNGGLEIIQSLGFALVLTQIAMIGGFISGLRNKLRRRNEELNQAMARIQELVNIDDLTGVCNRRRLFEVLNDEHNRYNRVQGPFSLCIVDIDHFKQVNDTYGHQAGDEILRTVAQSIAGGLRKIDCFGRYGGEEFLLILPQTRLEGAMIKCERVRQGIEGLAFNGTGNDLKVTVSIGVAEFQAPESVDETVARADKALYAAKDHGRNQTVSSEDAASPSETPA
jgi:diguanylate cyclase (GGDEF)-like protein